VFANLAKAFQAGRYAREKGSFRAYLAKMLRNELISRFRRCSARPGHDVVELTEAEVEAEKRLQTAPSVYSGPDDAENWKIARHRIAVEHVLTKTALSEQSRQIYRRLMESGDNCAEVARAMGIAATTVRQVKSRVTRMIAAFEKTLG
jgi:RNA polymerase sigma factor (sigma-70 family)